jgi:hypothetical protein
MPQTDDYGVHEILHMAAFLQGAVEAELCEHEAINLDRRWRKLADQAAEILADLYQEIGRHHVSSE